jgi:hypothetical protein
MCIAAEFQLPIQLLFDGAHLKPPDAHMGSSATGTLQEALAIEYK